MTTWSDAQIATLGAQASRFPTHSVLHWQALRTVVEQVHEIICAINEKMMQIEDDANLSAEGKKKKLAEIAREALAELAELMAPAESAAGRRIERLSEKMETLLMEGRPKDVADAQIASEIRAHVARSEAPAVAVLKLRGDKQAVTAILQAPHYLSNLSAEEASAFRRQVLDSTAEQREINEIENALRVCRSAIKSAEAMIASRAQMRQTSANGAQEMI